MSYLFIYLFNVLANIVSSTFTLFCFYNISSRIGLNNPQLSLVLQHCMTHVDILTPSRQY